MSNEKQYVISESQIQEIIEATKVAKDEPEHCLAVDAYKTAKNILTNLRVHNA